MQQKSLALGPDFAELELAWLEWGERCGAADRGCVHGLTRNAHDFDLLAAALAERGCRVIAVDVAGRGRSGWLADPCQYEVPVYAAQLTRLLELLRLARCRLDRHLDGRSDRHGAGCRRAPRRWPGW